MLHEMPIATDFLSPTDRPLGVRAVAHSCGIPRGFERRAHARGQGEQTSDATTVRHSALSVVAKQGGDT